MNILRVKKSLMLAAKIAIGSSISIYIATLLHLESAASAGTITLLTLMTTKWDTLRLSYARIITYFLSVLVAWIAFHSCESEWLAYGIFVFAVVLLCALNGWMATISVNAVVGMHMLSMPGGWLAFIRNEFMLVLIGVSIALLLNLFQGNRSSKRAIIAHMRQVEGRLQIIMGEMAAYLSGKDMQRNVWKDLRELENDLKDYVIEATNYQENTFVSHPGYFISYFEMRREQCIVLINLHTEMSKLRKLPEEAAVVAQYLLYLTDYVIEINDPGAQINALHETVEKLSEYELPKTREDFSNQAIVYHILLDIEDFLLAKKRFVEELDETRTRIYWNKERGQQK